MKHLESLDHFLNRILALLGGCAVLALMALATINVILRIFHMPYGGTYEMVSFFGAVTIAFALGYTQQKKNNIVVEILSERFPVPLIRLVDGISYLVMTMFFGIVAWQLFVWGVKIAEGGEVSETLRIIFYPFVFCVGIGFGVLAFTTFVDLCSLFFKRESQQQTEAPQQMPQAKEEQR
jgi:TRAP-type C4-dicarboxylate transport system permease small subunit